MCGLTAPSAPDPAQSVRRQLAAARKPTKAQLLPEAHVTGLRRLHSVAAPEVAELDRIATLQCNPRAKRCPAHGCRHMQLGNPSAPHMSCEACGLEYCYHHGDLHLGESCAHFQKKCTLDRAGRAFARQNHSKRCARDGWKRTLCKMAYTDSPNAPNADGVKDGERRRACPRVCTD